MTGGAARGVEDAIRAAHDAICAENIEYGDGSPPGTTLVAALIFGQTLTVGWVGDSRAYRVSEAGSDPLHDRDHSWINDVTANGGLSVAEAMQSPLAHALTRCLGPLDRGDGIVQDVLPDVRQRSAQRARPRRPLHRWALGTTSRPRAPSPTSCAAPARPPTPPPSRASSCAAPSPRGGDKTYRSLCTRSPRRSGTE